MARDSNSAIQTTLRPKRRDIGGFEVARLLPQPKLKTVGPFIFLDHIGPAEFLSGHGIDVRPHPHIGLATVTYLFEGEMDHRDSLGVVQTIHPGDVNWMTAGRGIVHSERSGTRSRAAHSRLHGMQSWVALPKVHEEVAPSFYHHPAAVLPRVAIGPITITLIAGTAFGATSPVATYSPLFYADAHMPVASELTLAIEHPERAVYIAAGAVRLDGHLLQSGTFVQLAADTSPMLRAQEDSHVMLLGGEPLDGERHIWWNFVSSSRERIERAKQDWREQRFEPVPGDREFIPLPD
jgi:redox-sensitive bicupin YhaK (pirin superfamily)